MSDTPPPAGVGAWLLATRPRTLTAAVAPVLVGTAVAAREGAVAWLPALAALLGAMLLQIGTNLANDYFDFVKGADTAERLGPTRVTQAGLIAPGTVRNAMIAVFAATLVPGVYLAWVGGWPIVAIGLASIASGYAYTGGPFPLGYNGLGDLFVFVFFGVVAVVTTVWLQTGEVSTLALVASIGVGALATAVLVVNNLRDAPTDARAGKRTLAVRLGEGFARAEYVALIVLAYGIAVAIGVLWTAPWVALVALSLPVALGQTRGVLAESGRALNARLGGTAQLLALDALLLGAGLVVGR